MKRKAKYDEKHSFEQKQVRCNCCNKCWLWVEGPMAGICICGGPYSGYLDLTTNTLKTRDDFTLDTASSSAIIKKD